MGAMNFKQTAEMIKMVGEHSAIAAAGLRGMADAISSGSPSEAQLAELRADGRAVIDAVPIAVSQMREWADATEKLGNLLWAALRDADDSTPPDGQEG